MNPGIIIRLHKHAGLTPATEIGSCGLIRDLPDRHGDDFVLRDPHKRSDSPVILCFKRRRRADKAIERQSQTAVYEVRPTPVVQGLFLLGTDSLIYLTYLAGVGDDLPCPAGVHATEAVASAGPVGKKPEPVELRLPMWYSIR